MAEDLGEKTEAPTPKRKADSRNEGQVARSPDLAGATLLAGAVVAVAATIGWMLGQAKIVMGAVLDGSVVSDPLDPGAAAQTIAFVGAAALRIGAPVLLLAWAAGFLSQFGQIGWLFAPTVLRPKLDKLNPIAGFKRIFGLGGVMKALLDVLKVLVVVTIVVLTIRQHRDEILVLPSLALLESLLTVARLMLDLALRLLAVLVLLGFIDFMWQRYRHTESIKMTRQEVKDEMKQTEGDADVKRRRHRMQQQIAMQRISSAVPKADVVVTNPEHLSIAIRYDEAEMRAPRVVAKGADHLALRIRQIAMRHGIPIVERKPLARALYRQVAVGQEIPPDLYAAVAEVLAYVYRLSGRMAG